MTEPETYDYIVVGGGAGGCVVAARLAEAGKQVIVIEAGDDPLKSQIPQESVRPAPDDYRVPAFHPFASENSALKWDFWVRHYSNTDLQRRDKKYYKTHDNELVDGVLYPRSSGLGGCAGHHAMIIMRPRNADWNHIANITGDASWKASNMQKYFRRLERCRYGNVLWRFLARLAGANPTGHGWDGWLTTERALPLRIIRDWRLRRTLKNAILSATKLLPMAAERWRWLLTGAADPNDERLINDEAWGLFFAPLSTARHVRSGPREFLLDVKKRHSENLTIRLNALATRVEIDPETGLAVAVHYREGAHLYEASAAPHGVVEGEKRVAARCEVILAGGAFNTPQLLMLSGIGERQHLMQIGVKTFHNLPGVGRNLQDRYEIGVVSRMKKPWETLHGVTYETNDFPYRLWRRWRLGPYASNGVLFSVAFPSHWGRGQADLFCFALLADFSGYYPRYSEKIKKPNFLTWIILKAYTRNNAGFLRLKSKDPLERPNIQFRYFDEGVGGDDDLDAMVQGVQFVRNVADALDHLVDEEKTPGRHLYTQEQLRQYVRENAWGHHACGTCAMKPLSEGGVVDSQFRVHGLRNLRVVDASIFPRIPGYFIITSIYMIAEKAADVILEAACNRGAATHSPTMDVSVSEGKVGWHADLSR